MLHKCWAVTTVTDTKRLQAIYNMYVCFIAATPSAPGPCRRCDVSPPEPFADQAAVLGWTWAPGSCCAALGWSHLSSEEQWCHV